MDPTLLPFFQPKGVVVVGASCNTSKLGYGVARNLVNSGFPGGIHFVSRKPGNLFGRPVYSNLQEVPDPVDLAVLIVPAPGICAAVEQCGQRGIHAAIVISSGFREVGGSGVELEKQMMRIAFNAGIRLVGPNCIGLMDTHFPIDTTFLPPPLPVAGDVAFISQSGAICAAIIDWARGQGFGFSHLISLGNQTDVNEIDMLTAVIDDPNTRVLTLYLESVSNGQKFIEQAKKMTRFKPIIALKVGRFSSGKRAAASHTGALAGEDIAYEAAFQKAGIIRATTSEEMFEWASALACCPLPAGRRMAVLTNAGGPGVIAADALESHGLTLAELQKKNRQKLEIILPEAAGLNNPIDMLASASPGIFAQCLEILIQDPGVDGVMVILPPPPMYLAEVVADELIPVIHSSTKPVIIALMGEQLIKIASDRFRQARIPEYRFPERAASALHILTERMEYLKNKVSELKRFEDLDPLRAQELLINRLTGDWLDQSAIEELMKSYGIPIAEMKLASSPDQARRISQEIGFPVVMKIASPDILHKSDLEGVILNILSQDDAAMGFSRLIEKFYTRKPAGRLLGVHIQQMLPMGQDVIVGSIRDPQFGAMLMFGSGGVEVEGLNDLAFSLAPLRVEETDRLINKTWAGRRLNGYRNIPKGDVMGVNKIVQRISFMVSDLPEIMELEINPLRVFPSGLIALDVRVKL
jgi:acetyl coenzyme A synthetase (ADP forming)-like protein